MSINHKLDHVLVASGSQLSGDINVANAKHVAIHFPVVTSGQVLLEGKFTDAASAAYYPISNPSSGSYLGVSAGPIALLVNGGSVSMNVSPHVEALTGFRINLGKAQTTNVSLAITKKF
jgi:hypothetical protein